MLFRRTRTHHTGASNLILKTEPCESGHYRPCSKRDSVAIINTARDGSLSRRMNTDMSPLDKSELYYQHTGRILKTKLLISVPRTAHLEERDKRKQVFTGDSLIRWDTDERKHIRQESLDLMSEQPTSRSDYMGKGKREIHATAIQETQLVGYDKYSADTLKNNVNLEKVREAKRVLRRKYANKTRLHSIYAAWDEERKGTISVENVFKMSQKLGLNLNVDEARVLLASANKSGKGHLELDEFTDLIYNKDDTLNLNMSSLIRNTDTSYVINKEELYKHGDNVIRKLQFDAEKMRGNKRLNQVHLVLKNKLNQIIQGFLNSDASSRGYVDHKRFEENIRQLRISENIISESDIKNLQKQYSIHETNNTSKIDYRAFIEGLKSFKLQFDEMYQEYKQPQRKKEPYLMIDDESSKNSFNIVDCRDLPCNMIDNFLGKRRKVSNAIKRFFPSETDFKNYVSKVLDLEISQLDMQTISQVGVKNIIKGLFDNVDQTFIRKRDFEGFVSSLLYNKHGYTNINDLSKAIYQEDEKEYYEKITYKMPGQPPHAELSGVRERKSVLLRPNSESHPQSKNRSRRTKTGEYFIQNNQSMSEKGLIDEDLKEILQKLDNTIFVGTKKHYDVYKLFDIDKDGFVSHRDLESKIDELNCLEQGETAKFIQYLDPTNKGYVTFKEFNNKIRPNMTQQDELGEQIVLSSVTPCKRFNQKVVPKLRNLKKKIDEITKTFEYTDPVSNEIPSRFGASPEWVNTFVNFQPPSKSGLFISETERLDRDHSQKTNYQREEKMKRISRSQSRIEIIKWNQDQLQKRIEQDVIKKNQTNENKLSTKALAQALSERRAKLRNGFAF